MRLRYFSMFSGIGGFEKGIEQSGMPGQCVGYSEIDRYATQTYQNHYGGYANYGDATRIDPTRLPDFGLLVGGFPCQAFSVAGKRKGFDEARGTLIFDVLRILNHKRPRHLVLENVKGLLTHDQGQTFQKILGFLADLGYRVEWQVLNSKDFGVPQNRERVYIVGHLGAECGRQVFPLRGSGREAQGAVHPNLDANYYKGPSNQRCMIQQLNQPTHSNDRVYSDQGLGPTLNTMQGGSRQPFVKITEATTQGYAEAGEGDSINLSRPNSATRRGRVGRGVANTLETAQTQATLVGTRIRRLTPTECERLQGFPDGWTIGSDTQRYKQCGNAVTVNVVEAVIRGMHKCLN